MIHLRCGTCGDVPVEPAVVDVLVNASEDFALYVFTCPSCFEIRDGGEPERLRQLLACGAQRLELRSATAPPLTFDDLLVFHRLLEADPAWSIPDSWTDAGPSATARVSEPEPPLHPR